MVRALSLLGLSALFLTVSPPLRDQVLGLIASAVTAFEHYAPFSYIVGVILFLVAMVVAFNRGSRPA